MVVDQIDIEGVATLESKNDPPIGANGDRPIASEVALQLMQPEGRQPQRLDGFRRVEHGQDLLDLADVLGANALALSSSKSCRSPLCAKPPIIFLQTELCKALFYMCQVSFDS
jgi:hypothetical protein